MNPKRKSLMLNVLPCLLAGALVMAAAVGASANEHREDASPMSMVGLTGRPAHGLRELSLEPVVLDKRAAAHAAAEASALEVEALAPYLEMHGRAEAGVRPVILPWSVRMESVN